MTRLGSNTLRLLPVLALLLSVAALRADQPLRTTLREQTLSADCIIYGKVLSARCSAENGRIYTHYDLSAMQTLKGRGGTVSLRVPGGTVGVVAYVVPGAPEFSRSEAAVLFLKDSPDGEYELDGLATGVYRVEPDADGLPRVNPGVEPAGPVLAADGHVWPADRPLPLALFLRSVASYLGESLPAGAAAPQLPLNTVEKAGKKKSAASTTSLAAGNVQAGYSRILDRPVDIFWDLSRDYGPVRGGRVRWYFDPDSIAGKSPYGVTPEQALAALSWSFGQWNAVPGSRMRFEYAGQRRDIPDHKLDLVNVITFADSEYIHGVQKDAIASARPFVLARRTWVGPEGLDWDQDGKIDFPDFPEGVWEAGTIIDCDLRWDVGGPYSDVDFAVDNTPGALSMQAVFSHEIGHLAGLVHSPIRDLGTTLSGKNVTPTMFSLALPNAADGSGNPMTSLEADDKVSLAMLYPTAEFGSSYGTIEGQVVKGTDGGPGRGDFVVALSAEGAPYRSLIDAYHRAATAIGVFSDQWGRFRIPGLPPGRYVLGLQPMDDLPTGTNRNAFNTLVSRFGDVDYIWDEFYNGARESGRESDPLDWEPVEVGAGGTVSGVKFITNYYPQGRERLWRMFGERDYIVAVNQLRSPSSAQSSTNDMIARKFPQVFRAPYRIVGAACDFASVTAPPEGAQVVWPEIILARTDPSDPSRPDLEHPLAVIRDFAGDGSLLSSWPLPFTYPVEVPQDGALWLVVRSPQGRFNAFHNIDVLGAGQGELEVDESFISADGGKTFTSVMGYGVSWRMGLELEGESALEPLSQPRLVETRTASGARAVQLFFHPPLSLSGRAPAEPVTISLRYSNAAQSYPEASLIEALDSGAEDGLEFQLLRHEAAGDSSLYRVSGLRLDRGRMLGTLEKLSGHGPAGGTLNLGRTAGGLSAGLEGLWQGTLAPAGGTVRLDLRSEGRRVHGAFVWPAAATPVADTTLVFLSLPGDTVLTVDSLPANPAGFSLSAFSDSGRSSLPAVFGLGADRFEPNERLQDAVPVFPAVGYPPVSHGLSAIRGTIASTKDRNDIDFFRFEVRRGDSVVIDVDASSTRPFLPVSGLDAYFEAFDSTGARFTGLDGRVVESDDESGLDPFQSFVSPRGATLYLRLLEAAVAYGDPGSLTGSNCFYELRLSLLPRHGDLVRDGLIRIDDALAAIDCVARPSSYDQQARFAADVNADGKVDLSDAAAVFRLALDDPLARAATVLAAEGLNGCPELSLSSRGGCPVLAAAGGERFGGLMRIELEAAGLAAPGKDLPRGAGFLQTRAGGVLYVLIDLSASDAVFNGGEIVSLEAQSLERVRVLGVLAGIPGQGETESAAVRQAAAETALPRQYSLAGASPNPFNPSTAITYYVPEGGPATVRLEVFDLRGQRVRLLAQGAHEPGAYTVIWDGTATGGRVLPSGVYFCRLSATGFSATRKLVLLK
ncbi:T9SS type A sorting domain-containing protein [bacterium]|nr:T9SS type A sorting domain-containing protein [bacterium]